MTEQMVKGGMVQKEPSSQEKQLIALGRALQSLREENSVDGLVKLGLDYLQTQFGYPLIWLGLYEPAEHRLSGKGGVVPNNSDPALLKQRFKLNPGDVLEQVVMQQSPMGVPDLREEPRAKEWNQAARKLNILGTIIFPIRHRDRCYGVVLLGSHLWGTSPHAEEKARLSIILGEMGEGLCRLAVEEQRRTAKRPEEPLLNLLTKLRSLPTLKKRLEATVLETQQFVQPRRSNIYWYEPEQRYFWKRTANRETALAEGKVEIPVQEVNSFYHTLVADQVVSVGEANSAIRGDITGRLFKYIQAQSLIAAPIVFQGELLGFLAVEGDEARIWLEEEKNFVRGAAQLVALTAPLEAMEETIQQVKLDQALTSGVSHALYSEADWKSTLKACADQVCQRLRVERFLVLLHDRDQQKFEICYQTQPAKRRSIAAPLENLNPVDWQMLERSVEAVGIENLEDDLKLMAWRQPFLDQQVRSLLVCSTAIGKSLEGLVIVAHESPRSWNRVERDLLRVLSQQIGLLLHQLQLQRQTDQLQKSYLDIQRGLTAMQKAHQVDRLEQAAVQQIAQMVSAPLVAIVAWPPGHGTAEVTAAAIAKLPFGLAANAQISIYTDALIQTVLQTPGGLTLSIADVTPETRHWLSGSEIGQVWVMRLQTAEEHEPTGFVIVGDRADRSWTEAQRQALETLVNQLAWGRRYLALTSLLERDRNALRELNWYKQRRIEEVYRTLGSGVKRLNDLGQQKEGIGNGRYPQILHHLGNSVSAMTPLLKHEQWQLHIHQESIALASLLRRALERIDSHIKQRQLWFQVHNDANVSVSGDVGKIEHVLYEILLAACQRSANNSRLDIWCRQVDDAWLEVSITDSGSIEPRLVEALQNDQTLDLLAPSLLDHPPGLHLAICRSLMQRIGGEFGLFQLEDQRNLSRLILPITTGTTIGRTTIQD